jgi:hypothetical protein
VLLPRFINMSRRTDRLMSDDYFVFAECN